MTTYRILQQMNTVLSNLDKIITKAEEHGSETGNNPELYLQAQLAPDMFNFIRQIQFSSDNLKGALARLSGKEAPKYEDNEQTFEQLHARIQKTNAYFDTFSPADFHGADERQVILPFIPGFYMTGHDYLHEMAVPNFYFHATTAYDLLRNLGVQIGKKDFLGHLSLHPVTGG